MFRTFLANVRYMLSSVRLSSVCLSVTFVRPTEPAMFLRHLVSWPSFDIRGKFYGDCRRGTPPSWGLNTREVAKYSDFGPIEGYISETVQDRR